MAEHRRRSDNPWVKYAPLLIYVTASLIAGAVAYGTLQTEQKYLRRDIDDLRSHERFLHGTVEVPGAKP